jgi:hypothetical protein
MTNIAHVSRLGSSLMGALLLACSSMGEPEPPAIALANALHQGVEDSTIAAIGYLRTAGTEGLNCSLTLIEPNIALTSAHCFNLLGNKCESESDAAKRAEVVFSPSGDDSDRHVYAVRDVAVFPEAFVPAPPDCPGGAFGPYSCDGEKRLPVAGRDLALIELAEAVPEDVARPIGVITSGEDDAVVSHGVHARLEDTHGPIFSATDFPSVVVGGWGRSNPCTRHRRIGLMEIAGSFSPYRWHQGCWTPQDCKAEYTLPLSSVCEEPSAFRLDTFVSVANAEMLDSFRLRRTSSTPRTWPETPMVWDGPMTNRGDSGGPMLLWLYLPGASSFDFYVVGTDSMGHNRAECGDDLPDKFMTTDFSVTFGRGAGEWIEKTIAAWVDVPSHCGVACGDDFKDQLP